MSRPIVIVTGATPDPCHGCRNRSDDGVYAMECFGCRRYYGADKGHDVYTHREGRVLPLLAGEGQ